MDEQDSPERSASAPAEERRRRPELRLLVQEMLESIRAAASGENWTDEARERAEEDLERIMQQVRREALRNDDSK